MQASPAYPDHPIAGALIAAAATLEPWINVTPACPQHALSGVHLVPIGPEGQSALDRDPDDRQRRRFGARSYGDLSDAVVGAGDDCGWWMDASVARRASRSGIDSGGCCLSHSRMFVA